MSRSAFFFFGFCFFTVLLGEKTDIFPGLKIPAAGDPFLIDPALPLTGLNAFDFQKGETTGEVRWLSLSCFPLSCSERRMYRLALVLKT